MIKASLVPTRLIEPGEREQIVITPVSRPSRMRSFEVLSRFGRLLIGLLTLAVRRNLTSQVAGERVRQLFEQMGGLWIKGGQLLSLRVDLFPTDFCQELAKLQTRASGFPTSQARQIIEEDLGAPIEQYFDEFIDKPFAAASIGQVYRAHLRQENVYVAVKVRKPYIDEVFKRDFVFIRWVVRILQLVRFKAHMRWDLGLYELMEVMKEELDFHYEASSIRRMKQSLRGHKIHVPDLFPRYCTERVLVTEFIHAALMADFIKVSQENPGKLSAWLAENNVQPQRIARRLIDSIFRQILENNLYHGDLHPGNIVLLRNSRIALIDFGTTNFTEREYLERFRLLVRALATRDYAKAADLCLLMAAILPNIDTEEVKEVLIRVLRAWATRTLVKELPYHDKSIDSAIIEVTKIMVGFRITYEWAWLRIHRALTTLDVSLVYLYPDVNYTRRLGKYFEGAEERALTNMAGLPMVRRSLGAYVKTLDIQDRINDFTMFQSAVVRRHAQVFRAATNKVAAVLAFLVGVTALTVLAVGTVSVLGFLTQHYSSWASRTFSPQTTAFVMHIPRLDYWIWLGIIALEVSLCVSMIRLRRELRTKDSRPHERVAPV